jgi:hypothetical protein
MTRAEWGAAVKGSPSGPAEGRPEGVPFTAPTPEATRVADADRYNQAPHMLR